VVEFAESLGGRVIVFAAFVVQIGVSSLDVINGALMLPVPAATPVGSGVMGILLAVALIRSRVESDRRKLQLEREKAGLLECVPQPLLYLGNDLEIQWTNEDAADFADTDLDELVGTKADEIWPADGEQLQPVRQALATAEPATHEISRDDGSTWVVHASPVVGSRGESLGVILLAMDITDIRQAQEALREANVQILTAREEERRRLAQDLHDSIAQGLTALQMTLHAKAEGVGCDTPEGEQFEKASQKAGQIGTEVRQISHQLYPPALDLLGLASALEEIFDPYIATGIECSLECADDVAFARFSQEVEVALYRTVQEAISNAVRHGQARQISVRLEQTGEVVRVTVIDNGCGFDVEANSKGLGMTSMNGRIDGVGGKLEISSRPGCTSVEASVPLERARRSEADAVASAK
jgi:PAS domain S-box-containing protein